MISRGKKVRIAYDLTVDGKLIKSVHANKPLQYVHGKKQILPGLEKALQGLKLGERKVIRLSPKNGYGFEDPNSIMEMPKSRFPKRDHFVGKEMKSLRDGKYLAVVKEVRKETLVLNFNNPLAGKTLHYEVVVIGIENRPDGSRKAPGGQIRRIF